MGFIELHNFMIYQHLNKRTKILPSATSHIAHLHNQFNYGMFAQPISMPRFKSIIFDQNRPKTKLFLQKNAKLSNAEGSTSRHPCLWQLRQSPQTPKPACPHCVFLAMHLVSVERLFLVSILQHNSETPLHSSFY